MCARAAVSELCILRFARARPNVARALYMLVAALQRLGTVGAPHATALTAAMGGKTDTREDHPCSRSAERQNGAPRGRISWLDFEPTSTRCTRSKRKRARGAPRARAA